MPRTARIIGVGYPYHIVQRGNNRQPVFFDDGDRYLYLKYLRESCAECDCKITAFCLMNNHVHILATPYEQDSLAKTMQKLGIRYVQYINKKHKRTGRLWECRFHSCLVDRDVYFWTVCRYIERNPVRAGIVIEPAGYKWSSARANSGMRSQHGFPEPIWKGTHKREEYIRFLNQEDKKSDMDRIKKSTYRGNPIGTDKFLTYAAEKLGIVTNTRLKGRPLKKKKQAAEASNVSFL